MSKLWGGICESEYLFGSCIYAYQGNLLGFQTTKGLQIFKLLGTWGQVLGVSLESIEGNGGGKSYVCVDP